MIESERVIKMNFMSLSNMIKILQYEKHFIEMK